MSAGLSFAIQLPLGVCIRLLEYIYKRFWRAAEPECLLRSELMGCSLPK